MSSQYDLLAPFYDDVIGSNSSSKKILLSSAKKYLKKNSNILELGCGTAENLTIFKNDYNLFGIDISAEMLKHARKKIPTGKFYKGDIAKFELKEKFDLIFCLYDTINHLESFSQWISLFKSVEAHLNHTGIFIFDFNTLHKLNILSQSDIYPEFPENDVLLLNVNKKSRNMFNWDIKYFKHVSMAKYNLIQSRIPESAFETSKILSGIKKHFKIIKTYNENFKAVSKNSSRVFCIAQKI
ncbi:MAG: class I SAM-dependent methyltransferase [Bacteroidetes bacterium]|nr:class I SAM-dependent methyltransferase [Bacteroidota bacterium]